MYCAESSLQKVRNFDISIILMKSISKLLSFILLVTFVSYSYGSTTKVQEQTKSPLLAIWKVKSALSLKWPVSKIHFISGIGFFIDPFHFITSSDLLIDDNLERITLSQGSKTLYVESIENLSAIDNIVIFKIKKEVSNYLTVVVKDAESSKYLNVGKVDFESSFPNLFLFSYVRGKLVKGTKKRKGKVYPHQDIYSILIDRIFYSRMSGSPVLDENNKVWGIVSESNENIISVLTAKRSRDLINKKKHPYTSIGKANEELIKLAYKGNSHAQHRLATMYFNGQWRGKDFKQAFDWYQESAKNGSFLASKKLSEMYSFGLGVKRDPKKAIDWLNKSIEQGHPSSWRLRKRYARQIQFPSFYTCKKLFLNRIEW